MEKTNNIIIIKQDKDKEIECADFVIKRNLPPEIIEKISESIVPGVLNYIFIHFDQCNNDSEFANEINNLKVDLDIIDSQKDILIFPFSSGCRDRDNELCREARELNETLKQINDKSQIDENSIKKLTKIWGSEYKENQMKKERIRFFNSYMIFCIYLESAYKTGKYDLAKLRERFEKVVSSKIETYEEHVRAEIEHGIGGIKSVLYKSTPNEIGEFIDSCDDGPIENTDWMKVLKVLKAWAYA